MTQGLTTRGEALSKWCEGAKQRDAVQRVNGLEIRQKCRSAWYHRHNWSARHDSTQQAPCLINIYGVIPRTTSRCSAVVVAKQNITTIVYGALKCHHIRAVSVLSHPFILGMPCQRTDQPPSEEDNCQAHHPVVCGVSVVSNCHFSAYSTAISVEEKSRSTPDVVTQCSNLRWQCGHVPRAHRQIMQLQGLPIPLACDFAVPAFATAAGLPKVLDQRRLSCAVVELVELVQSGDTHHSGITLRFRPPRALGRLRWRIGSFGTSTAANASGGRGRR